MKNCLVKLNLVVAPVFTIVTALCARSAIKIMRQRKQVYRRFLRQGYSKEENSDLGNREEVSSLP